MGHRRRAALSGMLLVAMSCARQAGDQAAPAGHRTAALEVITQGLDAPRLQRSAGGQFVPALGFGANVVLGAWGDFRVDRGSYYPAMAARFSPMGSPLHPTSVMLSGAESQFGDAPAIGFLNGRFLVAWFDDGPYLPWYRLMSADGTFLTEPELLVSSRASYGAEPTVSSADDHHLVVWGEFDGPAGLGMAVVLADGHRTTPDAGLGLGPTLVRSDLPRATWNGTAHHVAWLERETDGGHRLGVVTVTVDAGQPAQGPVAFLSSDPGSTPPAIASSAGWTMVAWSLRSPATPGLALAVNPPGSAEFGVPAKVFPTMGGAGGVALAPAPTGYLLLRVEGTDAGSAVRANLVGHDAGTLTADQLVASALAASDPCVVATPSGFFAAWLDYPTGTYESWVMGVALAPDGSPLGAPAPLAWSANSQLGSSVAAVDGGFVVSWYDTREDAPGPRVSRVSSLGVVESPAGLVLATPSGAVEAQGQSALGVASRDVWVLRLEGRSRLLLSRLSPDGVPVPGATRVVSEDSNFSLGPVPYRGGIAFAASRSLDTGVTYRVSADGAWLDGDAGVALPLDSSALFANQLVSTGQRLMLASWAGSDLALRWLEDDGGFVDAGAFIRTGGSGNASSLSGEGAVLLMEVPFNSNLVRLMRVREDGTRVDAVPIDLLLDAGQGPGFWGTAGRGGWNGDGWDVAVPLGRRRYGETGDGGMTAILKVPLTGAPAQVRLVSGRVDAAATDGRGRMLLVEDGFDLSSGVSSNRVLLTLLSEAVLGAPCSSAAACASGVCADGVCCDRPCGGADAGCETCVARRGSLVDGQCSVARAGDVCRPAVNSCDLPETCDGVALSCASDAVFPDGALCPAGSCQAGSCQSLSQPTDGGGVGADGGRGTGARHLGVGCSCVAVPAPGAGVVALLAMFLAWRRRRGCR